MKQIGVETNFSACSYEPYALVIQTGDVRMLTVIRLLSH